MCRASQEPGGPRRCAGDTRARLAAIAARTMQLERIERDLLDDLEIDAGRIREQAGAVSGTIAQQLREHNNELFRIACLDVAGRNDSTTGQQASIGTSQRVWNTCGIARAARTGPKMSIWTNTVKCTGNSSPSDLTVRATRARLRAAWVRLDGVRADVWPGLVATGMSAVGAIKFALSAQWLGWLAAIAAPLVANVSTLVDRLWVMPIALLVCCLVGGVIALTRGVGRGVGIIIGGFLIVLLTAALLRDPVNELVSDNGVLGMGRTLGFAVAQGAAHNGPIAAGGSAGQLDMLGAWLCDALLRHQIQMINFGMVVDDVPGCAQLWSASVMSGQSAAPAHAMAGCAPAALAHAQQLDVGTVGLFAVVIAVVFVVACAPVYVGCEVFRIGFKAFANVLVIIPAAAVAVAPGPPRRFAGRVARNLVIHGVETLAATAGLGILVLLMISVNRGAMPGTIGLTHPIAELMVTLLLAVAGALAFRQLLKGFGDRGIPGPVHIVTGAVGRTVKAGYALENFDYATRRGRGLWNTVIDSQRQQHSGTSESETSGTAAPGRRGHPPAPSDPNGGPDGPPPGAPPSSGGPRIPPEGGPGGAGVTPAQANGAARDRTGGPGAPGQAGRSGVPVGTAARVATTVAAPEAAAAAAVAQRVSHRGAASWAPGRHGNASSGPGTAGAQRQAPNRELAAGRGHNGDAPARRAAEPPAQSGATGDDSGRLPAPPDRRDPPGRRFSGPGTRS